MYSYDEVYQKSLEYFNGNELSAKVFVDKYALSDNEGNYLELTPDNMHKRLAKEFARIEAKYPNPLTEEQIYDYFKNFSKVIPQGSPMFGIGNPYQIVSLSNCFVIQGIDSPDLDSYGAIMKADEELVSISKRRGGIGMPLSGLRPKGLLVRNSSKTTDGIGIFMERFSNTIREVGQNSRRGALMETCSIHHPSISTFITIKEDEKKVTGANISVQITDNFMESVKNNTTYTQFWISKGNNLELTKDVFARDIWDLIINSAWSKGDPGVLFWDTILKRSPADMYSKQGYKTISTNPCSEIPLSAYDSCRLMVVNLLYYVKNKFTKDAYFDFNQFEKDTRIAQKLIDDLVDLEIESIDRILNKIKSDPESDDIKQRELSLWNKIKNACINARRTGLGITGLGDVFATLNMVYGEQNSLDFTDKLFKSFSVNSYMSSIDLAVERGVFPVWNWEIEKDNEYLKQIYDQLPKEYQIKWETTGRRNIANITVAPVGSISTLALFEMGYFGTTSGLEPLFYHKMIRRKKINSSDQNSKVDHIDITGIKWQNFEVFHSGYSYWLNITGNKEDDFELSPYYKSTANDINWEAQVDILAKVVNNLDHSASKTINLPNNATKELVEKVYFKAWELKCKGLTIYRDGCRQTQVLNTSLEEKKTTDDSFGEHDAPKRPKELSCEVHQVNIKGESWVVFLGLYQNKPYEIFGGLSNDNIEISKQCKTGKIIKTGKGKYDFESNEFIIHDLRSTFQNPTHGFHTRAISTMLRHGVPLHYIIDQIQKDDKDNTLYSFNKVISRVLKKHIKEGTKHTGSFCPSCGNTELVYQEGCLSCSCGYSRCS